jgi:hypothetical protein
MSDYMRGGCGHTPQEHEELKAPGVWETLRFIGYQPGDDETPDLEMRNVPGHECTLVKTCRLTEAERAAAHEYARQLHARNRGRIAAAMAVAAR